MNERINSGMAMEVGGEWGGARGGGEDRRRNRQKNGDLIYKWIEI